MNRTMSTLDSLRESLNASRAALVQRAAEVFGDSIPKLHGVIAHEAASHDVSSYKTPNNASIQGVGGDLQHGL